MADIWGKPGQKLQVEYLAENVGDTDGAQDIRLERDGVEEDRDTNITISSGGSHTGLLEWQTVQEDEGEWTIAVSSDNDQDSITALVSDIPDSIVDNFEEILYEDQDETLSDYYNGDLGSVERAVDEPFAGTYYLNFTSSDSEIDTTEDRLETGVTYEIAYYPDMNGGVYFKFFYGGSSSWYGVQFRHAGGGGDQEVNLIDADGTTYDSYNLGDNTYFNVYNRVQFTVDSSDNITVDVLDDEGNNITTLTGSGSGYSSRGYAFEAYNGSLPKFDELVEA